MFSSCVVLIVVVGFDLFAGLVQIACRLSFCLSAMICLPALGLFEAASVSVLFRCDLGCL